MHSSLEKVFASKSFLNEKEEVVHICGETSKGQCEFIQKILLENNFTETLEIGLAYGISTLAILEIVAGKGGKHFVIDKFQTAEWGGNGLSLIRQNGYGHQLEFFEDFSYNVLPKFIETGKRFDFAYIDSTKVFDWLLVDFFLIDKMLKVGGVIVFDDTGYYSVRKLSRFISRLPHYKVEAQFPKNEDPGMFKKVLGGIFHSIGLQSFSKTYDDYQKGLNAGCTAFRKTGEDQRDWKWHQDF